MDKYSEVSKLVKCLKPLKKILVMSRIARDRPGGDQLGNSLFQETPDLLASPPNLAVLVELEGSPPGDAVVLETKIKPSRRE